MSDSMWYCYLKVKSKFEQFSNIPLTNELNKAIRLVSEIVIFDVHKKDVIFGG